MRLAIVVALAAARTCGGSTDAPEPAPAPERASTAAAPEPPVAAGEPLQATIPLFSGDTTDLHALRGKVVILELSATDRPGWSEAHQHYRELLAELEPDRLEVVVVSIDPVVDPLREDWDVDLPPFVLGWDPQGALALRLGVRALPTTFVLDAQGRIVGATAGFDAQTLKQLDRLVREAMALAQKGPAAR
jgi:peroxiredoxin